MANVVSLNEIVNKMVVMYIEEFHPRLNKVNGKLALMVYEKIPSIKYNDGWSKYLEYWREWADTS